MPWQAGPAFPYSTNVVVIGPQNQSWLESRSDLLVYSMPVLMRDLRIVVCSADNPHFDVNLNRSRRC